MDGNNNSDLVFERKCEIMSKYLVYLCTYIYMHASCADTTSKNQNIFKSLFYFILSLELIINKIILEYHSISTLTNLHHFFIGSNMKLFVADAWVETPTTKMMFS